ncbi:MmpS family transport accessory protein [Micromonospora sp. NPDC049523]|uniref:MmpS family transport accessory protein n=1 Tax=Micromonospora sp. NPDC049523 TaxID=3155921 RepID=UPI00343C48B4
MTDPAPPQPPPEPTPAADPTPSPWAPPPTPQPWSPTPGYPDADPTVSGYPGADTAAPGHPPAPGYPPGSGYAPPAGYPPSPGYPAGQAPLPGYPAGQAPLPGYPADPSVAGYPPPAWAGTPAPVRGRTNTGVIAVVVVLAVLLCGGAGVAVAGLVSWRGSAQPQAASTPPPSGQAGGPVSAEPSPPEPTVQPGRQVVYQVIGDGPAEVSYLEYPNMPRQVGATALPWRVEFAMPEPGVVTVLAIRTGTGQGEITCNILVDGEVVITNSASGPYATATCAGLTMN